MTFPVLFSHCCVTGVGTTTTFSQLCDSPCFQFRCHPCFQSSIFRIYIFYINGEDICNLISSCHIIAPFVLEGNHSKHLRQGSLFRATLLQKVLHCRLKRPWRLYITCTRNFMYVSFNFRSFRNFVDNDANHLKSRYNEVVDLFSVLHARSWKQENYWKLLVACFGNCCRAYQDQSFHGGRTMLPQRAQAFFLLLTYV